MAIPTSKLDRFKIETDFGDGYVVQATYEWVFSARTAKGTSKWIQVKEIGAGAFGSVWLEKKDNGGELRAVKRLQRDSLNTAQFSQELLIMVMLADHKHLFVEFLGWYENDRDIFLAMEYVKFGDLSGYMKDHQRAKADASEVTRQILEALKILHGENICHRDLKPQNILVASLDPISVKLADFGVSKRTNNTMLRTWCGTQGYLAPELLGMLPRGFDKGPQYTYALDLWSLGCIVHQLLTSQIPFLALEEDGDMTGLGTSCTMVDMTSLYGYCHGGTAFSSAILQASRAPEGGIELVQILLVANPSARATAASALLNPWVAEPAYTSRWCEDLESEFACLGVKLSLPRNPNSRKQLRRVDIATVLPPTTNLLPVLQESLARGYNTAASMLLRSPSLESMDISVARGLIVQAFAARRTESVKLLFSLSKYDNLASCDHLLLAVNGGWVDTVQLLLDNKVDVNERINDTTVLHAAADHGNVDIAILLLQHGANVNAQCEAGNTALYAAAASGHLDVVKLLFSHKGKVNPQYAHQSALHVASRGGHLDVVKFLLDNKADILARARHGETVLQAAAAGGNLEIVTLLLNSEADVNAIPSERDGRTALQAASESGHFDIAKLLLQNKADVNAPPCVSGGRTALQAASEGGHLSLVKLLVDNKANVDAEESRMNGLRALQAAASGGYIDIMKLLLVKTAKVDATGATGEYWTPLQEAARNGHLDMAKLLLRNNSNINREGAFFGGRTALQAAAGGGHLELVKLLLNNMANINAKPSFGRGRTALQAAADGGHLAMVKFLLNKNADINATAGLVGGRTALQAAAGSGHLEMVKLLLDNKADINARSSGDEGRTALQAAAEGGHLDIVALLMKNQADVEFRSNKGWTPLQMAAGSGDIEMVKLLLEKADIHALPHKAKGRTALQAAAGRGHLHIVKLLLDNKANINADGSPQQGLRALHAAAVGGYRQVVDLLLRSGANVNALASGGDSTALNAAVKGRDIEMAKLLLENFADPNTKGTESTALQLAVRTGNQKIVELLLSKSAHVNASAPHSDPPLLIAAQQLNSVLVKLLLDNGATIDGPEMMTKLSSFGFGNVVMAHARDNPSPIVSQYSGLLNALKFW